MKNPANAKHMKNATFLRHVSYCVLLLFSSLSAALAANDIKADTTSTAATTNPTNWLTDDLPGGTVIAPATTDIGECASVQWDDRRWQRGFQLGNRQRLGHCPQHGNRDCPGRIDW